jgi:hypothetical protein
LIKNSGRDPSYSCTKTGDELFSEIKKYAQIELWGEGFDWFLKKRWNEPIIHRVYSEEGGSFPQALSFVINPEDKNKQTFVIPLKETDYNPLAK